MACLAILVAGGLGAGPAFARTTCETVDGRIIVTVCIAFRGATSEQIDWWRQEILDVWNGPNGYREYGPCKCHVCFRVKTTRVPKGEPFPLGYHAVDVIQWADGRRLPVTPDGTSCVAYMGRTTHSPSIRGASIDGVWSSRASRAHKQDRPLTVRPKDAAHEVGHMMGLPDYYYRHVGDEDNIMGSPNSSTATVTTGLVARIVKSITGDLHCPLCGTPSAPPPLEAHEAKALQPGLNCDYYEGLLSSVRNIPGSAPLRRSAAGGFDAIIGEKADGYALIFTGYVYVRFSGVYTFSLTSDNACRLFIADCLVADNDGWHPVRTEVGDIRLQAGYHPIRLAFVRTGGREGLEVQYSGPKTGQQSLPPSALFRSPRPSETRGR